MRTEGAGHEDVLVHNCRNLSADETAFPDAAHTLKEHVNVTPQEAIDLAKDKLAKGQAGVNSVWKDAETAQRVVDFGVQKWVADQKRRKALSRWLADKSRDGELYTIKGVFGEPGSLGTVYAADGGSRAAGNGYRILLQKMPGHRDGYIVYTAYPA